METFDKVLDFAIFDFVDFWIRVVEMLFSPLSAYSQEGNLIYYLNQYFNSDLGESMNRWLVDIWNVIYSNAPIALLLSIDFLIFIIVFKLIDMVVPL